MEQIWRSNVFKIGPLANATVRPHANGHFFRLFLAHHQSKRTASATQNSTPQPPMPIWEFEPKSGDHYIHSIWNDGGTGNP